VHELKTEKKFEFGKIYFDSQDYAYSASLPKQKAFLSFGIAISACI
jgi:hypothetical protein